MKQIYRCSIGENGSPLYIRLRQMGLDRILNRTIKSWNPHYGTYGMGGPGFFGLELQEYRSFPVEHLVMTVPGSYGWLLLNDKWINAAPEFHSIQKPLFCNHIGNQWDIFETLITRGIITKAEFNKYSMQITITNYGNKYLLEFPDDLSRLPPHNNGGARKWDPREEMLDAWIVVESIDIWI